MEWRTGGVHVFLLLWASCSLGIVLAAHITNCSVQTAPQRSILPVLLPPKPADCDVFTESCQSMFPSDYYSMDNILVRSRAYLQHNNPFPAETDKLTDIKQVNLQRLKSFFVTMSNRSRPVTITVLGGSLTAGRMVGGYRSAWPALMQSKLQSFRNNSCAGHSEYSYIVKVINRAAPGSASAWAVHQLDHILSVNSDLVIVDYDVNDCLLVRYNDNFVTQVQGVTELMVRRTLGHLQPSAAIVFFNVVVNHKRNVPLRGECSIFETCYSFDHIRRPVLSAYGIPIISTKAFWTHFTCAPPSHLWPCIGFCSHPTQVAHIMLSDLMSDFLISSSNLASSG